MLTFEKSKLNTVYLKQIYVKMYWKCIDLAYYIDDHILVFILQFSNAKESPSFINISLIKFER